MAVKFTKPEINVREKLAELDKPSGIAGEAMLRAETVAEQQALIGVGRRNLLINGDFQVSQRGDYTTAGTAPNAYVLDRWIVDRNGTATVQHTSGHDISGTPAICKAIKLVQTVTGNNYLGIRQKIENPSIYAGRTFTYSAWVRSNTANARIECYIPGTTPNIYVGPNHSGSGEWEYLSFTFTLNTGTPTDLRVDVFIDNGVYSNTTITAGEYVEVTMLQLEHGKVATPFEHRSYGEELALCQRYYQILFNTNGTAATERSRWQGRIGSVYNATRIFVTVDLPVTMRTTPTVVLSTSPAFSWSIYSANASIGPSTAITHTYPSINSIGFDAYPSGGNVASGYFGNACHMDVAAGYAHAQAEL